MTALTNLLIDVLLIIGVLLMIMSLVTGLVFLVAPGMATKVENRADQKLSLRRALKPVEIPRNTERFFYRHHVATGALIALLAAAFLWLYLGEEAGGRIAGWLSRQAGGELLVAWSAGLGGFLVVVNILAIIFGIVMAVRPSSLKGIESVANRWISTRKATRALEREMDPLGRFAMRSPRFFGIIVLVGSGFVLVNLLFLMGG